MGDRTGRPLPRPRTDAAPAGKEPASALGRSCVAVAERAPRPARTCAPVLSEPWDTQGAFMIPRPRVPRVRRSSIVLAFAVAALAFPLGVLATHQFTDVPTGASYHDDVDALVSAGVTSGCATDPPRYCPNNNVTRGQMAQFLNRLGNLDGNSSPSVDADSVDGLDASAFVRPLWAVINSD